MEVGAIQTRLDQIQAVQWVELMEIQRQQLELLTDLAARQASGK